MSAAAIAVPAIISLISSYLNRGSGVQMTDQQQNLLEEALQTQNSRVNIQNPLYEMATQLAMSLMPRSAQVPNPRLYNPYQAPANAGGPQVGTPGVRYGRPEDAPRSGWAVPRPGTETDATAAALATLGRRLPMPTSAGRGGINLQQASDLFQMPRQV